MRGYKKLGTRAVHINEQKLCAQELLTGGVYKAVATHSHSTDSGDKSFSSSTKPHLELGSHQKRRLGRNLNAGYTCTYTPHALQQWELKVTSTSWQGHT